MLVEALLIAGMLMTQKTLLEANEHALRKPPSSAQRVVWRAELDRLREAHQSLPRTLYDRPDLAWSTRNFACYFLFLYDTRFYDREKRRYRVREFLDEMRREFGGIDSVVLWHAYPRIGVDQRNQFDFYRDMPGGLAGLREVVGAFHRAGVKVFINYNPWDTGTRRESVGDAQALAEMVAALEADGIFLDTMTAAPPELREAVDSRRAGVIFEPEGHPPVEQLTECNASWAQWLSYFPEPSLLRLKWLEPRHMQHQIRRWDRDHSAEIEAAWFNGSGMLIWENIFGSHNPWRPEDKALWRKAVRILRAFAPELASDTWEPFVETGTPDLYANRWSGEHLQIYLTVYRGPAEGAPTLRLDSLSRTSRIFDLWNGSELKASPDGTVRLVTERLGAVAVATSDSAVKRLRPLLRAEREAGRMHAPADPVSVLLPPPSTARAAAAPPGMVRVPGGTVHMSLSHERRECGCYEDPGAPREKHPYWNWGHPFHETIRHDYRVEVAPFFMDAHLVTNADFEAFLKATRYRPKDPTNFLRHWPNGKLPDSLRDHPVVYVDLDDARAYARWAGKRLPTEAEWQLAGQGTDGRAWPWGNEDRPELRNGNGEGTSPVRAYPAGASPYGCLDMAGNVWQWTESERTFGFTRSAILRGGSFFDAKGSIWYVHGGPQPLTSHARFLLMAPSLDRCATIGFRCAMDAEP